MTDAHTVRQAADDDRPLLYLVDGYAVIYRAFYAMISRPLRTASGENTSAPFGLTRFLLNLIEQHEPDYMGVVLDAGHSFRADVYPEYKATREKMPEELEASLDRCRELVDAFNVPVVEADGWEADDVIATLAQQARAEDVRTIILSGDKDFYQLIDEYTWLLNPGRGGPTGVDEDLVTPENAADRLGIPPHQVVDYLALVGDSSDNVPGVRGIGKKTAPKLLEQFGTLEDMLEAAEDISSTRARNALLEYGDEGRLSRDLVTIRRDAPVRFEADRFVREAPDRGRLRDLCVALEFHKLAKRFATDAEARRQAAVTEEYELVTDADRAAEVADEMRAAGRFALDTETTSLDALQADLVGVSLAAEPGRAYYLPFGHRPPTNPVDENGNLSLGLGLEPVEEADNLPPITDEKMAAVRELLEDPGISKIGQNIKYDRLVLEGAGVDLAGVTFDTSLASYCLDPSKRRHGLDAQVLDRFQKKLTGYEEVTDRVGEGGFAEVGLEEALQYAGEDADYTLRLALAQEPELEERGLLELFREVEVPLSPVLAAMERRGIRLDVDFFEEMERTLRGRLDEVVEEILALADETTDGEAADDLNLNSVPQLRELLFEQMGLPVIKKTKTGPSTDEGVLTELVSRGHEVPALILRYRELEKLRSTYVSALPDLVNPETGRVHASFNQTVAATGRLSSSEPNLQNIPIRSELGRRVRKGFVPEEGWTFLGADYSQVELRILAHLSGDDAFVEAFRAGRDIHLETAARIFCLDPEAVTDEQRDAAKTINFATIYGQGPGGLARNLGISREEAEAFIDGYFERFDGVAAYIEAMQERAREDGFVETLTGRRRYIPEINSKNPGVRGFGERTAVNSPVQGTAADLIKLAMIRLHEVLDPARARMLVQVHDELVFEVREDAQEEVEDVVRCEMEGAM